MERRTEEDQYRGKRHTHPSGQEVALMASKNLKRSIIITIDFSRAGARQNRWKRLRRTEELKKVRR